MTTGTAEQTFVGGEWRPSASGETFSATSAHPMHSFTELQTITPDPRPR